MKTRAKSGIPTWYMNGASRRRPRFHFIEVDFVFVDINNTKVKFHFSRLEGESG
jgi:hypothetical protein